MKSQVLFEHIPKTGGVTFRNLLKRIYGAEKVFLINSRNIKSSLNEFPGMTSDGQSQYSVAAGHGAQLIVYLL
jgi:hypothetical protein